MKSEQDQHTLSAIQTDMLKELHRCEDQLLELIDDRIRHQEFVSMRYKEKECYDKLVELKRLRNTLYNFLQVTD